MDSGNSKQTLKTPMPLWIRLLILLGLSFISVNVKRCINYININTQSTTPSTISPTFETITAEILTPTATLYPPCHCEKDTMECQYFATRARAQSCLDHCLTLDKGDIHNLDPNQDGVACNE